VLQVYIPYEVKMNWDDDRRPFSDYGVRTLTAMEYGGMVFDYAEDCGGNLAEAQISVPPAELAAVEPCPGMCIDAMDGTAHCEGGAESAITPAEPPGPDPTSAPPQAPLQESGTVVYEGKTQFDWDCSLPGNTCTTLQNFMWLTFPLEGGEVWGSAVEEHQETFFDNCGMSSAAYSFTLTGTYDPAGRQLSGTASVQMTGDQNYMSGETCVHEVKDDTLPGSFTGEYIPGRGVVGELVIGTLPVGTYELMTLTRGP